MVAAKQQPLTIVLVDDEPGRAALLERALVDAGAAVTSAVTGAEVGRTIQRLHATGQIDAGAGSRAWSAYTAAALHWRIYQVTDAVLHRVRQPFPGEPVRTLDAVHLATAVLYGLDVAPPVVLSTDGVVRANAQALGFAVAPPD